MLNRFKAVGIDNEDYWDGGYMGNPALLSCCRIWRLHIIVSGGGLVGRSYLNTISKFHSGNHLCQVIKSTYSSTLLLCTHPSLNILG